MSPKRIAIYTSSFPPKGGGIATAHFNIFNRLSENHTVQAFVFRDKDRSRLDNVVRGVPLPGMTSVFRRSLRAMLKQPINRVLTNCDAIAESAASVMRMNGALQKFAPHLIICPDHYLPALMLKKPPGAKLAWMARHNYLRFTEQSLAPPDDFDDLHLAHRLERRSIKKADMLISPSQYMRQMFHRMFGDELPSWVASNFVNESQLSRIKPSHLRQTMNVSEQTPIVYLPSAGSSIKGARYLFEIVRRLARRSPMAAYIPGHMSPTLAHELKSLGPDTMVHTPGRISYEENLANVATCDLTVSPTLVENLSNALVESIMLGIPVVTFDTGGNKEIIHDNKTGCVVPYGDVEALIDAAGNLLSERSQLQTLRKTCPTEARRIVDRKQINATYEEVLSTL